MAVDFAVVFGQLAVTMRAANAMAINPTISGNPTAIGIVLTNSDSIFSFFTSLVGLLPLELGGFTEAEAIANMWYTASYAQNRDGIDAAIGRALANTTISGNPAALGLVTAFQTEWNKSKAFLPEVVPLLGPAWRTALSTMTIGDEDGTRRSISPGERFGLSNQLADQLDSLNPPIVKS